MKLFLNSFRMWNYWGRLQFWFYHYISISKSKYGFFLFQLSWFWCKWVEWWKSLWNCICSLDISCFRLKTLAWKIRAHSNYFDIRLTMIIGNNWRSLIKQRRTLLYCQGNRLICSLRPYSMHIITWVSIYEPKYLSKMGSYVNSTILADSGWKYIVSC